MFSNQDLSENDVFYIYEKSASSELADSVQVKCFFRLSFSDQKLSKQNFPQFVEILGFGTTLTTVTKTKFSQSFSEDGAAN